MAACCGKEFLGGHFPVEVTVGVHACGSALVLQKHNTPFEGQMMSLVNCVWQSTLPVEQECCRVQESRPKCSFTLRETLAKIGGKKMSLPGMCA